MPQIADNIKKVAVTRDGFQAQFIELDQVLFFDFVNHFNNFTTCIYCIIYKKIKYNTFGSLFNVV